MSILWNQNVKKKCTCLLLSYFLLNKKKQTKWTFSTSTNSKYFLYILQQSAEENYYTLRLFIEFIL